ncbi:MAG: PLDc N-terminal domain-containing protein [Acidobacteria bacterium]|nr:PLDc N-terminal domain-containing protein [Acidobacteriota bacterium]MBI3489861.1 PLDc N-terminal domain-containing protein [Acidobacteriota bacterium]
MFQPSLSESALILLLVIGVPVVFAWLGLLIQCANAPFKSDGDKIAWVLILLFLGPIGAVIYLIGGRARQIRPADSEKWIV